MARKYLLLENGMTFAGESFGFDGEVIAEVVFNTSMTGYIETLTEPSYKGQAVVQTFPLLGNYGVNTEDFESPYTALSAYIVREHCLAPSNFRSEMTLDSFMKEKGIVGLCGVDTRALTRVLRECGTMNGAITSDPASVDMDMLKYFRVKNPVADVTCAEMYTVGEGDKHVAVLDMGMRKNILRSLTSRGCKVTVCPANTSAEQLLALKPDGVLVSDGPGDPADNGSVITALRRVIAAKVPVMGVCIGHELIALANGFSIGKMKYGHRGANQPVRSDDGHVFITAQNHGYYVVSDSIDKSIASELFVNVNDGTNEGLIYHNAPVFTTQFNPEIHGENENTGYLYDRFITMMEEK